MEKCSQSQSGPLFPTVRDLAPNCPYVTEYDRQHFFTYARLATAHNEEWEWRQGATEILRLDIEKDEDAVERCYLSHVERALWIADEGFEQLLIAAGAIPAN
ncbi:MAG: DUF2285 domain-containing protein [Pseudomonadota bacterium]